MKRGENLHRDRLPCPHTFALGSCTARVFVFYSKKMDGGQGPVFTVVRSSDPRLVSVAHTFSAQTGASAISNVSVNAASNSNTVLTYSVIPPSPQVVIQRSLMLDLIVYLQVNVLQVGMPVTGSGYTYTKDLLQLYKEPMGVPLAVWGRDIAVARAYPLGQIVQSYNIAINNAAVQQQNASLPDLAHLIETPRSRASRATTARIPIYASWDDAWGTNWSLGSLADMQGDGDMGPGGFNMWYCDPKGTPLSTLGGDGGTHAGQGQYEVQIGGNNIKVPFAYGQPYTCADNASTGTGGLNTDTTPGTNFDNAGATKKIIPIFVAMRMRDVVMCSPFGFNYQDTFRDPGMYGISSMLINATLSDPESTRLVQNCTSSGCIMVPRSSGGGVSFTPAGGNTSGITAAKIWMTYLSPSITSTLPPRCVTPLCNLQYFQQALNLQTQAPLDQDGKALPQGTVNFSAVTFSNIPDVFVFSCRPLPNFQAPSEADYQGTLGDRAIQSFIFANQSGLFAGFSSLMLAEMSRDNGSKTPLSVYSSDGSGYCMSAGKLTCVGGAPLVMRPGKDFPLPTGVAVGSTGQCQLTFQITYNLPGAQGPTAGAVQRNFQETVTALSSAYFVTEQGVSRPLQVGLDEATVLGAPEGPDRYVTSKLAGGSFFSSLGSFGSAARNVLSNAGKYADIGRQAYEGFKNRDPAAMLAAAHSGYKTATGRGLVAGAGITAGAGFKRMRDLSSRLG